MFLQFNLYTVAPNLNPLIRRSPPTTLTQRCLRLPYSPDHIETSADEK